MEDKSGPEAGISGAVEDVKGRAKQAAGAAMRDERLQREGEAQQAKADAERDVAEHETKAEKARAEADVREAEQRSRQ